MSDITLSKAVRSNLLNLQSTANLLGKSQERLSSGLRVNSALDNPTNFFTAQGLNSRANDLSQLSDAVSNAVQTVAAADKGISAITKLVESAQATARQALQTAATVSTTTAATAGTVTAGAFTTVDVSGTGSSATAASVVGGAFSAIDFTNSGGNDGSISFDLTIDGATQSVSVAYADVNGVASSNSAVTASELATVLNTQINAAFSTTGVTYATVNGSGGIDISSNSTGATSDVTIANFAVANGASGSGLADGTDTGSDAVAADAISFTLAVDGAAAEAITIDAAAVTAYNTANSASLSASALTAQNVADIINYQAGPNVASVVSGALTFTSTTTGASSSIAIASFASAGTPTGSTGVANATDAGAAASTTSGVNPKRAELVTTYNDLLGQIDALAKDASYNGVNLLNGDNLSVLFNEDGSSKLDITGVTNTSAGLGLTALASTAFDDNTSINSTLDDLKSSIDTLRSQSAKFGSNLSVVETRQDFTKQMISVLQTGAANLTLADTNEEAANVLALQTRQQLSSTALSLASQADQNVLRLF